MVARCFGHRAPLLWIVVPFIGGLSGGYCWEKGPAPGLCLGIAITLIGLATFVLKSRERAWPWLFIPAMIFTGLAAYPLHRARLPDWETLPPRETRLTLRIERLYPQKDTGKASGLGRIIHAERHLGDLVGQPLYFSLKTSKQAAKPEAGGIVRAIGLFSRAPARAIGSGFEAYLCAQGINFRLQRGRMLATEEPPSDYRQFCIRTAERFHAILGTGLAEKRPELVGVFRAMMLGSTGELSAAQNNWFMKTGTMHLFAISGLHITSMALVLRILCTLIRLPCWAGYGCVLGTLWMYVDITGASPSAVRAFLMVALVETARLARQPGNSLATLSTATLLVLAFQPLQVFQAGFQMSYAIVAVLLLVGIPLAEWAEQRWRPFKRIPKPLWRWWHHAFDSSWHWFCGAFAVGVSTLAISLFFGVCYFKLFTPGSLLANLILIPISDWVLYAGLASLAAGLVGATFLSHVFNHAAGLLLWGMEELVRLLARIPGAACRAEFRMDWIGTAAIVGLLAASLSGYGLRWSSRRHGWLPLVLLTTAVFLAGIRYG